MLKKIRAFLTRISHRPPRDYSKLSRTAVIIYLAFIPTAIVYLIARLSPDFADFFNRYISQPLRILYAKLTNLLPFSFAEALLLLLPVMLGLLLYHAIKHRTKSRRTTLIYIAELISIAGVFLIIFIWNFGVGYYTAPLDDENKLNLDRTEVSAEELYETALVLVENVNTEARNMTYRYDGFSVMPYSLSEMNQRLLEAYEDFCMEYDFMDTFRSRVKPVMLSEPMSYTHITGVYSYFTGEANLNVVFPDYSLPYTAAHELAHQRGIARENEANFIAFLVCIRSDDAYLRYSGYLNLYEYVASALYRADPELYSDARSRLSAPVQQELRAYSDFFEKYRDSTVSEVSGAINNSYLQMQGTEGTRSYGLVVDLAVAYYKERATVPQ
ncbi:MAG: DUF3810 domain-containing protein [Clostridia bacterium]|nr:DUF3810 domain-containing protein [Clostridia bacterium]